MVWPTMGGAQGAMLGVLRRRSQRRAMLHQAQGEFAQLLLNEDEVPRDEGTGADAELTTVLGLQG
jgi:hypothetical protein